MLPTEYARTTLRHAASYPLMNCGYSSEVIILQRNEQAKDQLTLDEEQ